MGQNLSLDAQAQVDLVSGSVVIYHCQNVFNITSGCCLHIYVLRTAIINSKPASSAAAACISMYSVQPSSTANRHIIGIPNLPPYDGTPAPPTKSFTSYVLCTEYSVHKVQSYALAIYGTPSPQLVCRCIYLSSVPYCAIECEELRQSYILTHSCSPSNRS